MHALRRELLQVAFAAAPAGAVSVAFISILKVSAVWFPANRFATLAGKCTFLAPGMDEPEGNYSFTLYAKDCGEPGTADCIWIQVRDRDGHIVAEMSLPEPGAAEAAARRLRDDGNLIFVIALRGYVRNDAMAGRLTALGQAGNMVLGGLGPGGVGTFSGSSFTPANSGFDVTAYLNGIAVSPDGGTILMDRWMSTDDSSGAWLVATGSGGRAGSGGFAATGCGARSRSAKETSCTRLGKKTTSLESAKRPSPVFTSSLDMWK